jgi:tRNA 2-thiocytidine biosynthesis protein TtcA
MGYRTPLESRIAKKTTRAILEFGMVEDGDRVMVGLSGGKDSWALLEMLHVLRQRAPIRFSIIAVNVDSGYKEYKHDLIRSTCEARGWDLRIEHTSIGEVMDDLLEADATPCSLCARLRRGVLYRIAAEVGATKIALGHHADDFIETLLINLFFAGATKAMPARLLSDDGRHVVVRPFVYVSEDEARLYTKEVGLPVIGCCCPVCGDLSLQRQRMKRLLMQLEREHPGVKASLLKALGNVMPRHLLDRRLNPPHVRVSGTSTAPSDSEPSTPAFALGDDAEAGGDAGPVDAREPGEAARVIPLIVQHAATRAAGGSGDQGSATRAAVRESHAGETIRVAE